jgi:hypothetical protein
MKEQKKINEDVPVNNVGGGAIQGMGVGPKGEPGVPKKRKKIKSFITYMNRKGELK